MLRKNQMNGVVQIIWRSLDKTVFVTRPIDGSTVIQEIAPSQQVIQVYRLRLTVVEEPHQLFSLVYAQRIGIACCDLWGIFQNLDLPYQLSWKPIIVSIKMRDIFTAREANQKLVILASLTRLVTNVMYKVWKPMSQRNHDIGCTVIRTIIANENFERNVTHLADRAHNALADVSRVITGQNTDAYKRNAHRKAPRRKSTA